MQSSYSVIKNPVTVESSSKVIKTEYKTHKEEEFEQIVEEKFNIKDYEILGETIIKNARSKAESIMVEAIQKADLVEREAYEKGYEQGNKNGYEDGYKVGSENAYKDLENKINDSMEIASNIINKAEDDYKAYMYAKKEQIEKTIFEIAKSLAFREIQKDNWVISLLEPILEDFKGEENIIIRTNEAHIDEINSNLDNFRMLYSLKGEIFVLKDMRMNPGNVSIEKKNGKVQVGIDIALKEIEKILTDELGASND